MLDVSEEDLRAFRVGRDAGSSLGGDLPPALDIPAPAPAPAKAPQKATRPAPAKKRAAAAAPAPEIADEPAAKPAGKPAAKPAAAVAKKATRPRAKLAPPIEPEPVTRTDLEDAAIVEHDEGPLLAMYPAAAVTGVVVGGVMVLLFWFWLSSLILLGAAEVNKVIEHASPLGKFKGQKVDAGAAPDFQAMVPQPASRSSDDG